MQHGLVHYILPGRSRAAMNEELEALRAAVTRALEAERKKLLRRRDAIRKDMSRVADADEMARLAALAVPLASTVPRGAKSMSVVDHASGEVVTRELMLDPTRPARESLERAFRNARRLRQGLTIAVRRLADTEHALARLDGAISAVALADDADAVEALAPRPTPTTPRDESGKVVQRRKPPYRLFRTERGDLWVGRGAAKNDELTFRVAKPHHLWLHVRGSPGAHVVVPLARGTVVSSELLVDAAHLAAHFSDLRGSRTVEVSYVQRKFVRKPRGSAPGLVTMEREKVLALRVDDARTEHLLASEVA